MQNYKDKVFTIPNIMSMIRIVLIPIIVWCYCFKDSWKWTAILLIASGVTDLLDGFIARRFNMISDFGKAIDPVADKLTQFVMLVCLVTRFPKMLLPCVMLFAKEITLAITAMIAIKRTGKVEGADWHGKVCTCLMYTMMFLHVVWYGIPEIISDIMITLCTMMLLISFVLYGMRNINSARKSA